MEKSRMTESKNEDKLGQELLKTIEEELKAIKGEPNKRHRHHVEPCQDVSDMINDFPQMLKDIGIFSCIESFISNLFLMKSRPNDPCGEIHELLEMTFGSFGKNKTEALILQREYHSQLLKELRVKQEVGKLKALCHLLLPEEYGQNGELVSAEGEDKPFQQVASHEVLVELKNETNQGNENENDVERTASATSVSKKNKGKKKTKSPSVSSKNSLRAKKLKKSKKK